MQIKRMISTIDTHTAGEPTRIVTAGIPHIHGRTMMEKKRWLQNNDGVRRMVMLEPRGHKDMFGAIITDPVSEEADIGVIFMDAKGYLDMCGHGSIGSVTMLLNTGMIPIKQLNQVDSENSDEKNSAGQNRANNNSICQKVVIDTPAGKVTAHATIKNGVVTEVKICNVPAFYYDSVVVDLPEIGKVNVNISYGGNFFGLVNSRDLNIDVDVVNLRQLTELGMQIRDRVNELIVVVHPVTGEKNEVGLTEIYQDVLTDKAFNRDSCVDGFYKNLSSENHNETLYNSKNVVVFGNGQIDRSPCGTGTCAKMAYLYEKGKLAIDEPYVNASIINTLFTGKIIGETKVGNRKAILPEITGRAHITGFHNFIADDDDPFKEGFALCR
ncbi:MAG: proline racemase family protein [Desulfamplus sp.]|nr:proline racemase family protein [Desulfamplus sp.]